jgi:CRP/FNR family transcriptional regulator
MYAISMPASRCCHRKGFRTIISESAASRQGQSRWERKEGTVSHDDPSLIELRASPLFRELPTPSLARLAPSLGRRQLARGQRVFRQGAPAEGFFVILTGRVKVQVSGEDGKAQVLHFFGPGDSFGEAAMLEGGAYLAEAVAMERCRLLFVPAEAFLRELGERPQFAVEVIRSMARRLTHFAHIIEDLSLREVRARLACYLLRQGEGRADFTLPVGKGELAQLLGTTPESFSRALGALRDAGAIGVEGRRIRVLDPDGLAGLAGPAGSGAPSP